MHHLSIPAKNPLHVAEVITELFGSSVTRFGPYDKLVYRLGRRRVRQRDRNLTIGPPRS
jgi:hypothetical protein